VKLETQKQVIQHFLCPHSERIDERFKFSSEKSVGNLNFFTLTVLEFPSENMGENLLAKLQIFFTPDCL
jgi:hypothetical protein